MRVLHDERAFVFVCSAEERKDARNAEGAIGIALAHGFEQRSMALDIARVVPDSVVELVRIARRSRCGRNAREVDFDVDLRARIIELFAKGATYDEVASMLTMSVNTVRHHVRAMYRKLHVCSKAEAVTMAYRIG